MVFKVIPFNDFPCLWSVQVLCRLWFKFVLPVIVWFWSNFKVWIVFLQTCPDDYIVRICWLPWFLLAQS